MELELGEEEEEEEKNFDTEQVEGKSIGEKKRTIQDIVLFNR